MKPAEDSPLFLPRLPRPLTPMPLADTSPGIPIAPESAPTEPVAIRLRDLRAIDAA
jgi:hypothetical protein